MAQFPANDLDRAERFRRVMGGFWTGVFQAQDQVDALLDGLRALHQQDQLLLQDLVDTLSRYTTPLLETRTWVPFTIQESRRNGGSAGMARFGDGYVFGPQPDTGEELQHGMPRNVRTSGWEVGPAYQSIAAIQDRVALPQQVLLPGIDFLLDTERSAVIFDVNPFTQPHWVIEPVFAAGTVIDRQITLWFYRAGFDVQALSRRWGAAFGIEGASTAGYKRLLNAVVDALIGGNTRQTLDEFLAAMLDVPVTNSTQQVQSIVTDQHSPVVITDTAVYRVPEAAEITVAEGQTIPAGTFLTDGLQLGSFSRGLVPDWLNCLSLDRDLLRCDADQLIFSNEETPLIVELDDATQRTKVSWALGGNPLDVREFFNSLHRRGIASGKTMAQYLDTRTDPDGEPDATNLPTTIRPLAFLAANVLRNNVLVGRVRVSSCGSSILDAQYLKWLRRLLPPRSTLLLTFVWEPTQEKLSVDRFEDEGVALQDCTEPFEDQLTAGYDVRDSLQFREVSGTCH